MKLYWTINKTEVRTCKYLSEIFAILKAEIPGFSHIETGAYTNPFLHSGLTMRLTIVSKRKPLYLFVGQHFRLEHCDSVFDKEGCMFAPDDLAWQMLHELDDADLVTMKELGYQQLKTM